MLHARLTESVCQKYCIWLKEEEFSGIRTGIENSSCRNFVKIGTQRSLRNDRIASGEKYQQFSCGKHITGCVACNMRGGNCLCGFLPSKKTEHTCGKRMYRCMTSLSTGVRTVQRSSPQRMTEGAACTPRLEKYGTFRLEAV